MTTLTDIPSSSINTLDIDTETGIVTVVWKSSAKEYFYRVEDVESFEQEVMNNIPYSNDPEEDDKSLGRFINESIRNGTLNQLEEVTEDTPLIIKNALENDEEFMSLLQDLNNPVENS